MFRKIYVIEWNIVGIILIDKVKRTLISRRILCPEGQNSEFFKTRLTQLNQWNVNISIIEVNLIFLCSTLSVPLERFENRSIRWVTISTLSFGRERKSKRCKCLPVQSRDTPLNCSSIFPRDKVKILQILLQFYIIKFCYKSIFLNNQWRPPTLRNSTFDRLSPFLRS